MLPFAALADEPVVLVLGDSLSTAYGMEQSAGWTALLERRLDAEGYAYRVVNASISGETTRGALARLPRTLERHRPAIVIVALGGNDGLRGFPVNVMRGHLVEIIELSQAAGAGVLLAGIRIPVNYGAEYAEKFHAVYAELAKKHDVALVPFFMQGVALDPGLMQGDGIHPNAAAQPVLLDTLWPHLQPLLDRPRRAAAAGSG